jgi:hypothetical protein
MSVMLTIPSTIAAKPAASRPTYTIVLRPEVDVDDPVRALRALLKTALRKFGLRAIEAHEDKENQP